MIATTELPPAAASDTQAIAAFALMIGRMSLGDNDGTLLYHETLESLGWVVMPTSKRRFLRRDRDIARQVAKLADSVKPETSA
jgi:hypothetical protein